MSKIHVRSYLDNGAPQYDGLDRLAFIKLFRTVFAEESYIIQHPRTLVVEPTSKTIQITFNETPLFVEGHLIQIKDTDNNAFQSSSYRVLSVQNTTVIAKIDNYAEVVYPVSDSSLNIKVQLADLGWDICWNTDSQFSMRSSNPKSSRNVFTLKTNNFAPANTQVAAGTTSTKYATAFPVYVSRSIDTSTGSLIEDLTANTHNQYIGDSTTKQSLYFTWNSYSYSNSTTYSGLIPWYIIASDKFFYIFVCHYSNNSSSITSSERNYYRNPDIGCSRYTYMFGDPDFLGDPDFVDSDGTLLQASYNTNWDSSVSMYGGRFAADDAPLPAERHEI